MFKKYSHILISIAFCLLLGLINPFLCMIPGFFYLGREIAQAEHRYISSHEGNRADFPWYVGFYKEAWTKKGMLDWINPMIVSVVFLLAFYFTKFDYVQLYNLIRNII